MVGELTGTTNRRVVRRHQPSNLSTNNMSNNNNNKLGASQSAHSPPLSASSASSNSKQQQQQSQQQSKKPSSAGAEGNINVVVRCRARSPLEVRANNPILAVASPTRGTSVVLTNPSSSVTTTSSTISSIAASVPTSVPSSSIPAIPPSTKTYDFGSRPSPVEGKPNLGNVFGADADQGMIYGDVAKPILAQVLQGYNCTIFAYGQTGTGKTYTMEGDLTPYHGTFSPQAGIIPRTLYHLFDKLAEDNAEFTVRVSFVEIYNEELRDLNAMGEGVHPSHSGVGATAVVEQGEVPRSTSTTTAAGGGGGGKSRPSHAGGPGSAAPGGEKDLSSPATSGPKELRIYDDKTNGSGVVIHGLEETLITSAEEGLRVLKRGSERRQIAATRCNEHSSRSHSIFTIVLHLKETSKSGNEDLLKVGKLNLVDLAGSENVGRSGAKEGRAREAGMINASLLALGRVINKLVEKQNHIPYRESKLTRLLQDSLGGKTKTTIIATISPVNFEETISTLDYAARAKRIENRPEINQRMTKTLLLSQYATEIERLKADLLAAREKNGIFFSTASWAELSAEQELRRVQLEEAKRHIEINDSLLETTKSQFEQNLRLLGTREEEVRKLGREMREKRDEVLRLVGQLEGAREMFKDEQVLRAAFEKSRNAWKGAAGEAFGDNEGLFAKLDRKSKVESTNKSVIDSASSSFLSTTNDLGTQVAQFQRKQQDLATRFKDRLVDFSKRQKEEMSKTLQAVDDRLLILQDAAATFTMANEVSRVNGETFLALVEGSRDVLVRSTLEHATKAEEQRRELSEVLEKELGEHEAKLNDVIEQMVAPVTALQEEAKVWRKGVADRLRTIELEDRKALAAENARLSALVDELSRTLDEQREVSAREDAELIELLTSTLQARSTRHLSALVTNCDNLKARIDGVSCGQRDRHEARGKELSEVRERNKQNGEELERRVSQAIEGGRQGRQALESSIRRVHSTVLSYHTVVEEASQQQIIQVSLSSKAIEAGSETFQTDASTSHQKLDEAVSLFASSSQDAYADLQGRLGQIGSSMEVQLSDTVNHVSAHTDLASSHSITSTKHIDELRHGVHSYLKKSIQEDVPTGSTPRKREWPRDVLLPSIDLDEVGQGTGRDDVVRKLRESASEAEGEREREKMVEVEVVVQDSSPTFVPVPLPTIVKPVLGVQDANVRRRVAAEGEKRHGGGEAGDKRVLHPIR
ncbi:kinesin-domain-containing protein [Meredithblackwellia eburnea MCA 4105]